MTQEDLLVLVSCLKLELLDCLNFQLEIKLKVSSRNSEGMFCMCCKEEEVDLG